MDSNKFKKRIVIISIAICCIILFTFAIYNKALVKNVLDTISNISTPFIIGFSLAYIILPLCKKIKKLINKLTKNKLKDKTVEFISIAISEITAIALIAGICIIIVPELFNSITSIIYSLPDAINKTTKIIDEGINKNAWLKEIVGNNSTEVLNNIKEYITNNIKTNIENLSASVFSGVTAIMGYIIDIVIGIFISIFVLSSRKQFARQSKKILYAFLGREKTKLVLEEVSSANDKFMGFFVGKIVDSLIIGAICFVGVTIMRMPYAGLISFIVCITNIVPIIGPFIGAIPSAILVFSISPIKSLYFLIFILILQQLDGNYIGPKCIGNSVKLNTFYVLFALILFGELWGMIGMIIGVPLFAVLYDIIKKVVNIKLDKKGINENEI